MTAIDGLPWDLDDLPLGIVDPMDAYRPKRDKSQDDAPRVPREMTPTEAAAFARRFDREVRIERARLALVDPIGEIDAVAPLDGVRARQVLLEIAEQDAKARARAQTVRVIQGRPDRRPDGRDLLTRLGADPNRGRGVIRCPAHEDRSPSLSWRLADDGRALVHCHAGCTFAEILAAVA